VTRFIGRCWSWLAVLGMIAGGGTVDRLVRRRALALLKTSTDNASASPVSAQAQQLQEQLERMREKMKELPPEAQDIVKDVLAAQTGAVVGNPLVLKLASPGSRDAAVSIEENVVRQVRSMIETWHRVEPWFVGATWATFVVFGLLGMVFVAISWGPGLALCSGVSLGLSHVWFAALAFASAALFAFTGRNAWYDWPASFLLAPAGLVISGMLFRLKEGADPDDAFSHAACICAGPLCSFGLVVALALIPR